MIEIETITLPNGVVVPKELIGKIRTKLEALADPGDGDPKIRRALVLRCLNPNFEIDSEHEQKLRDLHFLQKNGAVPDATCCIVLAAVDHKGNLRPIP